MSFLLDALSQRNFISSFQAINHLKQILQKSFKKGVLGTLMLWNSSLDFYSCMWLIWNTLASSFKNQEKIKIYNVHTQGRVRESGGICPFFMLISGCKWVKSAETCTLGRADIMECHDPSFAIFGSEQEVHKWVVFIGPTWHIFQDNSPDSVTMVFH